MKIIKTDTPVREKEFPNGSTRVIHVNNYLRFEGEDLIKEKEEEGYDICVFLDKIDVTPYKTHFLPEERGKYRNEVMWRASFIKL